MDIAQELLNGNRLALSRAITAIENEYDEATEIMKALYPHTGHAFVLGITGPPGAGKSTLTDKLAREYRKQGKTVGIIAVDPTSPFSGGAILGDRIRMNGLTLDEGVFIRSMGTRGSLGGLSHKTADAVKALDAFGKDIIFVETVGVGQSEVDIVKAADTTMVVLIPGMGDDIQAIKAGILEIADVYAVNKADLDGTDHAVTALQMMLDLGMGPSHSVMHHGRLMEVISGSSQAGMAPEGAAAWRPPIIKTVATHREGIAELAEAILAHQAHLRQSGDLAARERERAASELETIIQQESLRDVLSRSGRAEVRALIERIVRREVDPYTAARSLMGK